MKAIALLPLTIVAALVTGAGTKTVDPETELRNSVMDYIKNPNASLDMSMVEELREKGYKGLAMLRSVQPNAITTHEEYMNNEHYLKLFDKVSGQKDGVFSYLYWHTDLEKAKEEARKENKLILSLRMLGDFSEDLSCANSRFFRTLLYSDMDISTIMRNNYVLHVSSVIEVPKITITYPDGTTQTQTITGNSMHMVMTAHGEILDALPGLYGPTYFRNWLNRYTSVSNGFPGVALDDIETSMAAYCKQLNDLKEITKDVSFTDPDFTRVSNNLPAAFRASDIAVGKGVIERPIFKGVIIQPTERDMATSLGENEKLLLSQISAAGFNSEAISEESQRLISYKKKFSDENPLAKTVIKINQNLTIENLRNEVQLHTKILEFLKDEKLRNDDQAFVAKVYKEVFLTPLDDKKMGMYDETLFYGLTNDGF